MTRSVVGYRDPAVLPRLGTQAPSGPIVLDTNVFINALAGRGPPELRALLANLPNAYVSAATLAELNWTKGRLAPEHPQTAGVLAKIETALEQIAPTKVLVPSAEQWSRAGVLAGSAARAVAGEVRSIATAHDRMELLNDAVTAIVSADAGAVIVTQDRDFDLFMQLAPGVDVLFYGHS